MLLSYRYLLKKRLKDIKKELLKPEMVLVPMANILEKIISKDNLIYPRLDVFEQIAPSPKG